MVNENAARKIDSLGRVVIPKFIRDKAEIKENDEVEFYTLEENGRNYICFAKVGTKDRKWEIAAAALLELGYEVPEELEKKLV